jgi:hypothetical protein
VDFKQLLSNNQYFTGRVNEAHQLLVQAKENPGQDQQTQQWAWVYHDQIMNQKSTLDRLDEVM